MPDTTFSNIAVLTGAGFTKNFGGFDAQEMLKEISENAAIQSNTKILSLLNQEKNFETAFTYALYHPTDYSPEEIEVFREALEDAYKKMEEQICICHTNPSTMHLSRLGELVHLISKYTASERAFWFTLNQDLFLERQKHWKACGVDDLFSIGSQRLNPSLPPSYKLPSPEKSREMIQSELSNAIQGHVGPAYIKLHGSLSWESYTGKPGMVLGINKLDRIREEPLLDEYFKIFENYFQEENRRVVIIGYGFRDQHINDVLLNGIARGLKLIIVSTSSEEAFRERLNSNGLGQLSDNAVYFQCDMKTLFESNLSATLLKQFKQALSQ